MRTTRVAIVNVTPEAHPVVTIDEPCTALTVYVDAHGDAGIVGALVSVYAYVEGVRARVGAPVAVTSPNAERVIAVTGVAAEMWDVEIVSAGVVRDVSVAVVGYGTEP